MSAGDGPVVGWITVIVQIGAVKPSTRIIPLSQSDVDALRMKLHPEIPIAEWAVAALTINLEWTHDAKNAEPFGEAKSSQG